MAGRLSRIGLFPGQDGLLYHLSQNDGQTMSALVEKMQIRHPTLFTMVGRMEKAGWVKKEKSPEDKRASPIYLNPQGRSKLAELTTVWQEIEGQVRYGLQAEEVEATLAVLKKLNQPLNT